MIENSKTEVFKGHLAAIIVNIIYGLNINVSKSLFSSAWMTPIGLTMTRVTFTCVTYWIISFFFPKEKISFRNQLFIGAAAFLGIIMGQAAFALALGLITPVTMSLISALNPFFILLLSVLFSIESISPIKVIGVITGISGTVLVVLNSKNNSISGINYFGLALALINVISYSSHILIIRKMAGKMTPITMMKWMYLWSAILLSPLGIPELSKQRIFTSEIAALPALELAYTVLLSSLLGSFLMPVALKRIKATSVSMYMNFQPLAASAAAIIVGQDVFSWDKPLALLLIVTGVFIVTRSNWIHRND